VPSLRHSIVVATPRPDAGSCRQIGAKVWWDMRAAIRTLVATVLLLPTGCVFFSHGPEVHDLERLADVTLHGLVVVEDGSVVAVGEGGLVVKTDQFGNPQTWDLGDVPLRAIEAVDGWADAFDLVVVGDHGFIVHLVANDTEGYNSFEIDTTTDMDLRDVQLLSDGEFVIVGDGVVLRGTVLGPGLFELVTIAPPDGSWGSLRALTIDRDGVLIAVGDEGRLLSSDDLGITWTAHELETDADLLCICHDDAAYGRHGTRVQRDGSSWVVTELDPAVDYLACDQSLLVSSDMRIHDMNEDDFAQLEWQPRAIAQYLVVGDGGHFGIYTSGSLGEI
jgi:hypothetical protein